ncbi:MAG: hypothetical protein F6K25_05365 [Okeania sp. SIO2G4]|uniref:SGNH/GDSL hydrolase family protein n=1 Tax=Okeania sp. SIO2F5 TaxID=2607794 RepID=UPI0013BDCEA2|nr:SGNH/GDSL hydrolase family protein [Okeania sp. SIO2F5]NEP92076.1 hypothetical protein [Okeania sp. SIO2F5]NEQ90183.1 hypothetical protein [Okeania sp. SIO2G4]
MLTVVDNDASSPDNGLGGDNTFNGSPGDDNFVSSPGNNSYDGGEGQDTVNYASNKTSGLIANLETGEVSRKFETWSEDFKILPLGDSNTSGYPSDASNAGYRNELWRSLNGAGYNIDFVGTAYSGPSDIDQDHEGRGKFTINQLTDNASKARGKNHPSVARYTNIEDTLATYDPNMVLVMAGTNDINKGDSPDTALADLGDLVDRMNTALPESQILVASILPNFSNSDREARTEEFNERIPSEIVEPRKSSGHNVHFVDIFNTPLESSDITKDGYHLTASGYDKIAEVWEDAMLNTVVAQDTLTNIENLIASDGDDELIGDNSANQLTGGLGDDTLTGGGGNDVFIYSQGDGTDIITDFEVNNDKLGLSNGLTFSELTIENAGTSTEVKVTLTNEVLTVLEGVIANDITSSDFITV